MDRARNELATQPESIIRQIVRHRVVRAKLQEQNQRAQRLNDGPCQLFTFARQKSSDRELCA